MDLPVQLVVAYSVFSLFLFYQKLHLKNFQGDSAIFRVSLSIYVLISTLYGFGFLVYWGVVVSWSNSGVLFLIALATQIVWFLIEGKLGLRNYYWMLSTLGLVMIPVLGYVMWLHIP